jgi:hypothetical protein
MQVRIDDNQLHSETTDEHPLFQTHRSRSRSGHEQPAHGRRRISIRASVASASDGSFFCPAARDASMVQLVLHRRRALQAHHEIARMLSDAPRAPCHPWLIYPAPLAPHYDAKRRRTPAGAARSQSEA